VRHDHHEYRAAGNGVKVKRELEDGWFQHVEMPLPALLTVQSGATKLRTPRLWASRRRKTKEIRRIPAEPGRQASIRLDPRLYAGEDKALADSSMGHRRKRPRKLVEKLRFEARVL